MDRQIQTGRYGQTDTDKQIQTDRVGNRLFLEENISDFDLIKCPKQIK